MIYKFTGTLVILFGFGLALHFGGFEMKSQASLSMPSSSARLYKEWTRDLRKLRKKNQLHKGFNSIKEVSYTPLSSMSAQWLSSIRVPIKLKHQGIYKLNLEVDHLAEKKRTSAIVHYQLVHIESGNTVWEFGRTYSVR